MNLTSIKVWILSIFGIGGSSVVTMMGGWDTALESLLILMAIDYFSGLSLAIFFKRSQKTDTGGASSKVGFVGIVKKGVILGIVLVAYRIDLTIGSEFVRTAAILAFIINEIVSITENAGVMGIPIPNVIKMSIDMLKKRSEENEII